MTRVVLNVVSNIAVKIEAIDVKSWKVVRNFLSYVCGSFLLAAFSYAQSSQPYLIGRGMADVTGPVVGVQLWGFGRADQVGEGIHTRQRSRAFVVAEAQNPTQRLVFVSADLGSIDHHMSIAVVERLQAKYPGFYSLDNVILSATHTHSGPGGYWQSRTTTGLDGGLFPAHFEAIVAGLTESIVRAHEDLQPGNVFINTGKVADTGANRSVVAYMENPAEERARYSENTNTEMTLLKFVDATGDIGMLNWYALHPTAMNFYNRLISGDHKGYASLIVERKHGTTYKSPTDFVAAFAQSDPGDVTPNMNLDNTGPGATDVETTSILGDRQLIVAEQLFSEANEALHGSIDTRRIYVDLSDYEVADKFTGAGAQRTCPSAYGYSFAGGSTEDGGANFLFREGMTEQSIWRDWLIRAVTGAPKWTESVRACQEPKPILFETGTGNPSLQSQVRSVTIARIGQFVILAMPTEVTTMAGRRLRESVMNELGDWAKYIVLAGYSNGYAGYVTTPEEYLLQQYEASHTLHGRWSLPAYQQVVSGLAANLEAGSEVGAQAIYEDWRAKSEGKALPAGGEVVFPKGVNYGDVLLQPRKQYAVGDIVEAEFWSAHPTAHFSADAQFMTVEQRSGSGWIAVADDGDWSTRVRWEEEGGAYVATLSWELPEGLGAGQYRLSHTGSASSNEHFIGVTEPFVVASPVASSVEME